MILDVHIWMTGRSDLLESVLGYREERPTVGSSSERSAGVKSKDRDGSRVVLVKGKATKSEGEEEVSMYALKVGGSSKSSCRRGRRELEESREGRRANDELGLPCSFLLSRRLAAFSRVSSAER